MPRFSPLKIKSKSSKVQSDTSAAKTSPRQSSVKSSISSSEVPSTSSSVVSEESKAGQSSIQLPNDVDSPQSKAGFQVHVRIRPLDEQDIGGAPSNRLRSTTVKEGRTIVLCTRPSAKKENGHHTCVVTYGSPGTGKSHALFGKASSGKHKGIIQRAAESLLFQKDKPSEGVKLSMSFLQLYNEKFYDILNSSATDNIRFRDNYDSSTLDGVTIMTVENIDDVTKQLRRNPNRLRDAARSHTIFTLYYCKEEEIITDQEGGDSATSHTVRTTDGKLVFVDLVGVGRSTKHSTHESPGNNATAKANKSLQAFSKVIQSLSDRDNQHQISYRDSKLTRLLKDSLGGDCATRLLVTASSCPNSAHETLVCLQFATSAMMVKNIPLPHVSERQIEEEHLPVEENELSVESTDVADDGMSANSSEKSHKAVTSTLPPINMRPSLACGAGGDNFAVSTSASTHSSGAANDTPSSGRVRKGNLSRSAKGKGADTEGNKKSKKRHKFKPSDAVNSRSSIEDSKDTPAGQYWQIDSSGTELVSCANVLTLPRIGTPDNGRYPSKNDVTSLGDKRLSVEAKGESPAANSRRDLDDVYNRTPTPPTEGNPHNSHRVKHSAIHKDVDLFADHKEAFAASLVPASFDVINSRQSHPNLEASLLVKASPTKIASSSSSSKESGCCSRCLEREEQIKANYDRLIVFSKRDRDLKQERIEELETMLVTARQKDLCAEMDVLKQERNKERKIQDILEERLLASEEAVKTCKKQMTQMVSASEVANLQELRRKENDFTKEQHIRIDSLSKDLAEQTKGATRMLEKKSDQIRVLEEELKTLKECMNEKEHEAKSAFSVWQNDLSKVTLERDKIASMYEGSARETCAKLATALTQVEELKTKNITMETDFKIKIDNLEKQLTTTEQKLAESQRELEQEKQSQSSKVVVGNGKSLSYPGIDAATNTEDVMKEKLSGLAYSIQCLRCAAKYALANGELNDSPDVRDAELRILLFQDTKNREVLVQLKRERDLLRDVMKIMYMRQWFTEEGKPHVKRTLRRVGIDGRDLEVVRRKSLK